MESWSERNAQTYNADCRELESLGYHDHWPRPLAQLTREQLDELHRLADERAEQEQIVAEEA